MHPIRASGSILALAAVGVCGCGEQASKTGQEPRKYQYESVAVNPDVRVPDGFRGDVHPLLHGDTELEVTARWKPTLKEVNRGGIKLGIIDNASAPEYSIPDDLIQLLTESTPAEERATYGARELSVFLPQEITGPGQMWKIDPERAALFLKQFDASTSTGFDRYHQPYGRRPGPAGAYGILRAISADHLDVLFRVHAELDLADGRALYTPACFLGRMLVDRRAGTVEFLEMHVPTDRAVNVNLTLTFPLPADPNKEVTNIVFEHVEPMELVGGDRSRLDAIEWDEALDLDDAHERLKSAFYKFMDIDWIPAENMLEVAQELGKPIVVVVLTSPLDDQSC